jgi:hypothetical protein
VGQAGRDCLRIILSAKIVARCSVGAGFKPARFLEI